MVTVLHVFERDKEEETEDVLSPRKVTKVRSGGNIVLEWIGLKFKSHKLTTWSIMAATVTGLPSKLLPVGIDQRGRVGGGEGGLGGELRG